MGRLVGSLAFGAVVLGSASASADVIDPRTEACSSKEEGEACDAMGKSGVCKKATCSRLDYSQGTPPKSKSYDCIRCQPGEPDGDAAPDAKEEPTDANEEPTDAKEEPADAKEEPAQDKAPSEDAALASTKDPAKTEPETQAKAPKSGGCAVGASPVSLASVGLGLLILGFLSRRS